MPPDGTGGYHPHESPLSMLVPLALLAVGAIFSGLVFHYAFLDRRVLERQHRFDEHLAHAMHEVPCG
jgi:NADH-quinone oxidoreductase subunit L